jgi:tetratricopeptide (TPR) repeat protein
MLIAALLLITGLIYLRTLSFGFVNWDDDDNIRTNKKLTELNIDNVKYHFQNSRYKALAIWSYMADNWLFSNKPAGFHMHNLALHLINVLLLFILLLKITKRETVAFVAATLFAVHPVFVEAVAWITGRKDLLFMLFSLLSAFSYIQYLFRQQKILWFTLTLLLVYIASLAKIQAFTLPLIFIGFDLFYSRKVSISTVLEKIVLFVALFDKWGLTILLYFLFITSLVHEKASVSSRERKAIYSYWYLLILCMLMFTGNLFYKELGPNKIGIINYGIASLFLIVGLTLFFKRKKVTELLAKMKPIWSIVVHISPLLIVATKLFLSGLIIHIPTLQFWTLKPGDPQYFSFGERLLLAPQALIKYFLRLCQISGQNPMISYPQHTDQGGLPAGMLTSGIIFYIIMAAIIFIVYKFLRKNKLVIFGLIWFFASISVVLHIIPIEGRIMAADRYAYPSFIGLFLIIGALADLILQRYKKWIGWTVFGSITLMLCIITFIDAGTWRSSRTLWEQALKADEKNHYAMYSLSLAYFVEEKNPGQAMDYANQAILLSDNYQYFNNRGRIRFALRDFSGALQDFTRSIKSDSNNFSAYNNRGAAKLEFADLYGALNDYQKALKIKPDYEEALSNRRNVLHLIKMDSMVASDQTLTYIERSDVIGFIKNTAQRLIDRKDNERAAYYLNKGIKINPADQAIYEMLAVMYHMDKKYDQALAVYNLGLEHLPSNATLLLGRGFVFLETGDTARACSDWHQSSDLGNQDAAHMLDSYCRK